MSKSSLEYSARWRLLYSSVVDPWNPLPMDSLALTVLWLDMGVLGRVAAPRPTARQMIWARQVVATVAARHVAEHRAMTAAGWKFHRVNKLDS